MSGFDVEQVAPGDVLVMTRGPIEQRPIHDGGSKFSEAYVTRYEEIENRELNGYPLRVLAVLAPFLRVRVTGLSWSEKGWCDIIVDTRRVELCVATPEYVAAFPEQDQTTTSRVPAMLERCKTLPGDEPAPSED